MPQLYDPKTGAPLPDAAPDEQARGILAGTHGLDPSVPVPVRGPDGWMGTVPASSVPEALQGGYSLLSHQEELMRTVGQEEGAKGVLGSVSSGVESGLNQLLLGVPEAFNAETDSPREAERRAAEEEYHKPSRILGGILGFGGSLLAGGEIFKGVDLAGQAVSHGVIPSAAIEGAGLATKLAAGAVKAATEGTLLAAPQATVQAAFGDPKKAAETLLWGLGAGTVLGGGAELLGSGLEAGGDAIADALNSAKTRATVGDWGSDRILKATGAQSGVLSKLSSDWRGKLADEAMDIAKPGMSRQELGEAIIARKADVGEGLGDVVDKLDSLVPLEKSKGAVDTLENPPELDYEARLKEAHEAAQGAPPVDHEIADARSAALPGTSQKNNANADHLLRDMFGSSPVSSEHAAIADAFLKPGELGTQLRKSLDSPELNMPENADQKRALEMVVEGTHMLSTSTVGGQQVISFETLNNYVSGLGRRWQRSIGLEANKGGARGIEVVTPLSQMQANAYGVARNVLLQKSDNVAAAAAAQGVDGAGDLVGSLAAAKEQYAKLADLEKFAMKLDAQRAGNRFVSLTDMIHMGQGPLSSATSAAGAAIGSLLGPGGAVAGSFLGKAAGIPLDFMAKKWIENRGLVYGSLAARKFAKEGPDAFAAVLGAEGQARLKATMESVGDTISDLAIRGTSTHSPSTHVKDLLGGETTGLSKDQQYDRLTGRLNQLASNPQAMVTALGAVSAPFVNAAPQVAQALQGKLAQAITYLHASVPRSPAPATPFSPTNWSPSPAQKLAFHDRAEIVSNPMRAVARMASGTLSVDHLDALTTIYPEVQNAMRQSIAKWAGEHPEAKLPYRERQSVSKFMGAPLEPSLQPANIAAMQSGYSPAPVAPPESSGGGGGKKFKLTNLPSHATGFSSSTGASTLAS